MKETVSPTLDRTQTAVLHEAGGKWSVLVADVANKRPRIVASRRFPDSERASIAGWLDEQNVGNALVVVPASSVVCRTFTLPDAPEEQLKQGLELQVEAHLNGLAPHHRVAMAVLPSAESESNRSGLVLAWPETATVETPELNCDALYTADVAALAALLGTDRPDDPLLWVDRHSEAVALALTHSSGAVLRATREGATDKNALSRGVRRALAETALNVGHTADFVEQMTDTADRQISNLRPDDAALLIPPALKNAVADRIEGTGADNQWWSDYGIAVGALLARTGELSSLTGMIDAPPIQMPSIVQKAVNKLSQPRIAATVVVAVILILALSPIIFSGLRLAALKIRYSDIDEKLAAVEKANHSLTMYRDLEPQAWSMTKLLGDIGANTPLGIELEVIRLRQGSEFTVAGRVSPRDGKSAPELVSLMERQLRESGIFTDVTYKWREPTANDSYEFDMRARVAQPHRDYPYPVEQDFAIWSHEMRRNNEPAPTTASTKTAVVSKENSKGGATSGATVKAPDGAKALNPQGNETTLVIDPSNQQKTAATETDNGARRTSGIRTDSNIGVGNRPGEMAGISDRNSAPDPGALPEMLTAATIRTLTYEEAVSRWAVVARAMSRHKNDEELSAKLKDQFDLLKARVNELKGTGET